MQDLFLKADIHRNYRVVQLYITVFNFAKQNSHTYNLFEYEDDLKKEKLTNKLQILREKFGVDIVKNGSEII